MVCQQWCKLVFFFNVKCECHRMSTVLQELILYSRSCSFDSQRKIIVLTSKSNQCYRGMLVKFELTWHIFRYPHTSCLCLTHFKIFVKTNTRSKIVLWGRLLQILVIAVREVNVKPYCTNDLTASKDHSVLVIFKWWC